MISTKEMLSEFLGTDLSPSRFNPGTPTVIAGVTVPAKPIEPTNCCQSGCINCVWEIFNDDVMEWQTAREKAVAALEAKGGTWPEGIEPPSSLKPQNMSNTMHQESKKFGPKLQKKPVVPVGMLEFAAMEKRIKKRQQER
ncbi:hypothetical protein BABINDRAFT_162688 [Babjeviella inositovora NRRL Y-12698]|uniref:Oxidoreductase-like domain-containing protein n=1 Tax=Babjeviella inositovora NRRL Y-12698 TaxID=984486 RepID=A0A1E3QLY3_9ASCO|nr:uncharacterized protein BABINDRAFT_162688 [Babjeviella inositovora NRRL Y-12698]ODQ78474.1 hypothetical protein BABINDRAFT_162688 [Babjeviella inositovora NRRL Y-12698]